MFAVQFLGLNYHKDGIDLKFPLVSSCLILSWVKDLVKNRKQKVSVDGAESACQDVTSGISQGSVLEPILFVIYINDMTECVDAVAYLLRRIQNYAKKSIQYGKINVRSHVLNGCFLLD
jgi:hypothetical protein